MKDGNEREWLRQLGERSRAEEMPPVDVARRVVRQLEHRPAPVWGAPQWAAVACACSLWLAALSLVLWLDRPAPAEPPSVAEVLLNQWGGDPIGRVLAQ